MALENPWIRYVDRTYQQIKDRVLTQLHNLVPEMTDNSESNPFVKLLSIWSGIAEMLGYYIDTTARESHISTTRLYKNMVFHAQAYNYRVHARTASTADVTFTLSAASAGDYTILAGTELKSGDISFFTLTDVTILAGDTEGKVSVKQQIKVAETFLVGADGSVSQAYFIPEDILDKSLTVRVDSVAWNQKETLSKSLAENVFVQTVNWNSLPMIKFGDGLNGNIPESGKDITIEYYTTSGENVDENTINTIVTALTPPIGLTIAVNNPNKSSGGQSTVETLEQLRKHIPMLIRTNERAVTRRDYIETCELKPEVAKAGLEYRCGKYVDLYIVPLGGGLASESLLSDTKDWMDIYRMITTKVQVFSAGEIRILQTININVKDGYTRSVVRANLLARLLSFYSEANQEIRGSVYLSDIYETVENTEGVQNSNIFRMTPKPYARPLNVDTPLLDWDREILSVSTGVNKWEITFTAVDTFELVKNGNFISTFTVGVEVVQTEVIFTISVNGTIGDNYEFFTYPFFGTIELVEQSLPTALEEDIVINASGGL